MKKLILAITVITLAVASCKKKNDDDKQCEVTVASLSGTYRLTAIKYKVSANTSEQDVTDDFLEACQRDDNYVLSANGVVEYEDAGTVCNPDESYTSTWSVSGNTIVIDGDGGTVESFNCTTLRVYTEGEIIAGDKVTLVFTKQ